MAIFFRQNQQLRIDNGLRDHSTFIGIEREMTSKLCFLEGKHMGILQVEYPDTMTATLNMDRIAFEREARMAMATKLFELGRLTSGQAAALADVNRADFLLECSRYGVASVNWDKEELLAEFEGIK